MLLFISYNEPRLSTRSNHTARNANHDHGAVGAGTDATWDREDCGMWSCNGGSVGTQVQGRQGHRDSRQHGSARRTPFRSPQRSSTTSRICFISKFFFHVLPSPLDSAFRFRSSVVCFLCKCPNMVSPHLDTNIQIRGITSLSSIFDVLKNVYLSKHMVFGPKLVFSLRRNG